MAATRTPSFYNLLSFLCGFMLCLMIKLSDVEDSHSLKSQELIFNQKSFATSIGESIRSSPGIKNEEDPVPDLSHEYPSDYDDTPDRTYTGRQRPPIYHTNAPPWEPMRYSNMIVLVLCAPKYMDIRSIPMHRTWASQVDHVYYLIAPWEDFDESVAGFSEEDQASVKEMDFVDIGTQYLNDDEVNIEGMKDGKWKVMPGLKWAWEAHPDFEWYMVVDDDTYMIMENTMYYLNKFPKNQTAYIGASMVLQDQHLAFIQGGSGIMFNQLAMSILYDWLPECIRNDTHRFPYGDAMLGHCLKKHYPEYKVGTNRHTQFESIFPYMVLWNEEVRKERLIGAFHIFREREWVQTWYDIFKITQEWSHIPRITVAELEAYLPEAPKDRKLP